MLEVRIKPVSFQNHLFLSVTVFLYWGQVIAEYLRRRIAAKKPYTIIVVAEGIKTSKSKKSAGSYIARLAAKATGLETRETILGYIQRGGSPTPMDRILATRLGAYAAELINQRQFGQMAALKDGSMKAIPLKEVAGKIKLVPREHSLIARARSIDTNFGDRLQR